MTGVRIPILAVAVALLAAQAAWAQTSGAQNNGTQNDGSIAAGRRLAATHCSRCHAVDRSDQSANPRAPRFRNLGRDFPFEGLRAALRDHMIVGHPEMPVVVLGPPEIDDLIAYLKSLQTPDRPRRSRQRET